MTLNGDGSFSYTPTTCGVPDSFTYRADDGPWNLTVPLSQFSNTVSVAVTVSCASGGGGGGGGNAAPTANPDTFTVVTGASQTLDVLANDTDPDNNPLTITSVTTQAPMPGAPARRAPCRPRHRASPTRRPRRSSGASA